MAGKEDGRIPTDGSDEQQDIANAGSPDAVVEGTSLGEHPGDRSIEGTPGWAIGQPEITSRERFLRFTAGLRFQIGGSPTSDPDDGEQPPRIQALHEPYQMDIFGGQGDAGAKEEDILAQYLNIPNEIIKSDKTRLLNAYLDRPNEHSYPKPTYPSHILSNEISKDTKKPYISSLPQQDRDHELMYESPRLIIGDDDYPAKSYWLEDSEIGSRFITPAPTEEPWEQYPGTQTEARKFITFTSPDQLDEWLDKQRLNPTESVKNYRTQYYTGIQTRTDASLLTEAAEQLPEEVRPTITIFDLKKGVQLREFAQTRRLDLPKHGVLRIPELQDALAEAEITNDVLYVQRNYDTETHVGVVIPLDRDLSDFWRQFYQLKAERGDAAAGQTNQSEE